MRQPPTSSPISRKPRLNIPELGVPFQEDAILEEDRRHNDVVRSPPEHLDRVLLSFDSRRGWLRG